MADKMRFDRRSDDSLQRQTWNETVHATKPTKRGIKVWECADSANGYVVDLSVKTGKERDANAEQGLGYRVVHKLTRPLVGKNHHVFVDNCFSSIPLAENLLWDKIYLCGTVRSNWQGIPQTIAPTVQQVKRLRQGDSPFLRKGNLVITVWKDKKPVYFLSTQSNPVGDEQVKTGGSEMEALFKFLLLLLSGATWVAST